MSHGIGKQFSLKWRCPHCKLDFQQYGHHYCKQIYCYISNSNVSSDSPLNSKPNHLFPQPKERAQVVLNAGRNYHFDDFVIQQSLGSGGFGVVLLCKEPTSEEQFAIKMSYEKGDRSSSFKTELQALEKLAHPNLRSVLGRMMAEGQLKGIVLEYLPQSLYDFIYRDLKQPIPDLQSESITKGIIAGLQYLHGQSFIHRDIKPQNVLLDPALQPKISDLGSVRLLIGGSYYSNSGGGTTRYQAPHLLISLTNPYFWEKLQYTVNTDWYSFAITIWELYARRLPFSSLNNSHDKSFYEAVALKNKRPSIPPNMPVIAQSLVKSLWAPLSPEQL